MRWVLRAWDAGPRAGWVIGRAQVEPDAGGVGELLAGQRADHAPVGDHRDLQPVRQSGRSWRETRRSAGEARLAFRRHAPPLLLQMAKSRSGHSVASSLRRRAQIAGEHAALAHQRLDRDRQAERVARRSSRSPERADRGSRPAGLTLGRGQPVDQPLGLVRGRLGSRADRECRDRSGCARNAGSTPTRRGAPGSWPASQSPRRRPRRTAGRLATSSNSASIVGARGRAGAARRLARRAARCAARCAAAGAGTARAAPPGPAGARPRHR